MFKKVNMPQVQAAEPKEWRLDKINGGVVYTDLAEKIMDNQSPSMMNEWFKDKFLSKRYGQEWVIDSLGDFPILNIYNKKFNGKMIFATSTKLCSLDLITGTVTELYNSLTAVKGSFFVFRNKLGQNILYYKNGHEYVQYDGTTVSNVTGYIPTVVMGRSPTGGGSVLEQYNRLQAGFITSFSPDGVATVYTLPQSLLDATTVTCTLLGVTKVEGVDFTVNRTTGQLTFSVAPVAGTDTLKVTAYKTDAASKAAFMETIYTITFGGDNDNRVFFAGGSNTYYYSGLLDPTYIPENQYNNVGDGLDNIYGFGKQYNVLVVFKSRSMYAVTYSVNSDGSNVRFTMAQLNDNSGCDMPWTIQLINDNLVWCHSQFGVSILNSTLIKDEKNVSPISLNINGTPNSKGLLDNGILDLINATSYDFWGMYMLCVGSKVYAWDYVITSYVNQGTDYENATRLAWFPFNNINANCFFDDNGELYIGDRTVGRIAHFINDLNDFDTPIEGYWTSKILTFGFINYLLTILGIWFTTTADVGATIEITHLSNDAKPTVVPRTSTKSYNWSFWDWSAFAWQVVRYSITVPIRIVLKNIPYYQIRFRNNVKNQNLSISDLIIRYVSGKEVR